MTGRTLNLEPWSPSRTGHRGGGGWHWGYFIQYTDTTLDFIVDYNFGSNTRSNTKQYNQYKVAEAQDAGGSRRARGARRGLGRIKIKSKSMSKIGRDPPVLCWTREPVRTIDFVARN
jgi:hypothetical protein